MMHLYRRHFVVSVSVLAALVCVQLPPEFSDDLTIDMSFISINLHSSLALSHAGE